MKIFLKVDVATPIDQFYTLRWGTCWIHIVIALILIAFFCKVEQRLYEKVRIIGFFWFSHFIIKWLGYNSFVIFQDICMNVHWTSHKWRQFFKPHKILHILYTVALNYAQIVHQPTQKFFKRCLNFYQFPVEWSNGWRYVQSKRSL